jgi:nucleoid-associated protein EbfC
MTENPNPFGDAGFDLGGLLEQAQQMQTRLMQSQAELATQEVSGSAGAVRVTLTGVGELTGVEVTPGAFDGSDAESLADLGDLVVAAYRDAKAQVDALTASTLGPLAGVLGMGG